MERLERFFQIDRMLRQSRSVTSRRFMGVLGISISTLKRDLEYMRDRMEAPIEWDGDLQGYRYASAAPSFSLPGLWLTGDEVHALLVMRALLDNLGPGLLSNAVDPFVERLEKLLLSSGRDPAALRTRIKVLGGASRRPHPEHFRRIATAILDRRQIRISHFNRSTALTSERTISPQRLIHHRGRWYTDAWCHMRADIRSFSIDAIEAVEIRPDRAHDVPFKKLDETLLSSYGIFSGAPSEKATLRFSPTRSRWIEREVLHPDQTATKEEGTGRLTIIVPYHDDRELIREILRHGSDVEVIAPRRLREKLAREIESMVGIYRSRSSVRKSRGGRSSPERPHPQ